MTKVDLELLVLPYTSADGRSLLDLLVAELSGGSWRTFRAAVAFVRSSGNFPVLLDALMTFAHTGGEISLTFGADLFGSSTPASDHAAVADLLAALVEYPDARIHLYHEPGRTFHPKFYLFANEKEGRALFILGSSNWSEGGLLNNVEANVVVRLDFNQPGHAGLYDEAVRLFTTYWSEE